MTRNKKVLLVLFVFIFAMAVLLFWIVVYPVISNIGNIKNHTRTINAIEAQWAISLPGNSELEYYADSRGFTSDGIWYLVFKAAEEPTEFIADFLSEKNEEFMKNANECISFLEIPEVFLPDWEADYLWRHMASHPIRDSDPIRYYDHIYIIFYPNIMRLIVVQFLC